MGKGHPAIFHHPSRDIKTLVHGDDYVSSAMSEDLDWLESELGKAYEIKTQRTKPKGNEEVDAKVLNRVVRRNNQGYEIEADPRHAELIVEQVLETGARTLSTPGINPGNEDEEGQESEGENATKFRSLAARCNYLSLDRPDLQYAVKEICREMAKPTKGSWSKLQRIAQF